MSAQSPRKIVRGATPSRSRSHGQTTRRSRSVFAYAPSSAAGEHPSSACRRQPGECLVVVSGCDYRLAWPAGASLSANDHAIQQEFAAPDAPRFAALKRTIQAGGPSLTAGAHISGSRDATGIVSKEQLGRRAARQPLAGDVCPLDRSAGPVTSPSLTVRQASHGVSTAHRLLREPLPGAACHGRIRPDSPAWHSAPRLAASAAICRTERPSPAERVETTDSSLTQGPARPAMTEIRPKTRPPASAGIPTCSQHFVLRTGTAPVSVSRYKRNAGARRGGCGSASAPSVAAAPRGRRQAGAGVAHGWSARRCRVA